MSKFALQYFDRSANAWATFYNHNDRKEAEAQLYPLTLIKKTRTRVVILEEKVLSTCEYIDKED